MGVDNMIVGIMIGLLMALFLFLSFYLGYRYGSSNKIITKHQDPTEEDKEKLMKMNKGLNAIMNYDINTAYGREVKWKG